MNRYKELTKGLLKKQRIDEIDLLRGIPIFVVVLYHFCFTFSYLPYLFSNYQEMFAKYPNIQDFIYFLDIDIFGSTFLHNVLVPLVGGLFIFVCGISSILSKNNGKRSLLLWLCSIVLSLGTMLVTYISKEDLYIDWGVLHLMAFSVSIYAIIEFFYSKILHKKMSPYICLGIASLIFLPSICLYCGFNPFTFKTFKPWPTSYLDNSVMPIERYIKNPSQFFLQALGKLGGWTDWWPIFPYTGVFFLGAFFGILLYQDNKKSKVPWLHRIYIFRPICFVGKHTIWIYLLHQPIIIVVLFIVFYIMGFRI